LEHQKEWSKFRAKIIHIFPISKTQDCNTLYPQTVQSLQCLHANDSFEKKDWFMKSQYNSNNL
jgi:hypothetical protein